MARKSAAKRGYDRRWKKARAAYLVEHPTCAKCPAPATCVDHIVPHRGDKKAFWNKSNWAAMCKPCHDAKSATERTAIKRRKTETRQAFDEMKLRDRVKSLRRVCAGDLLPNPRNWRVHGESQQNALRGILAEVGIAGALLARETPDGLVLIDGHLRADVDPDTKWPVLVLDVTEAEADKLLAVVDPIAAMAEPDPEKLDALLREIDTGSEALQAMLAELADEAGLYSVGDVDAPELADGDKEPFQQMTFTLHDSQAETVKAAIDAAKHAGEFDDSPNENSNGNALARIAEAYLGAS